MILRVMQTLKHRVVLEMGLVTVVQPVIVLVLRVRTINIPLVRPLVWRTIQSHVLSTKVLAMGDQPPINRVPLVPMGILRMELLLARK